MHYMEGVSKDSLLSTALGVPAQEDKPFIVAQKRVGHRVFLDLSLDIHLMVLYYLRALDIFSVQLSCRALARVTQNRSVWENAFRNALAVQKIPVTSYEDIIKNVTVSMLKGMASIPDRLIRRFRAGGTLFPHSRITIHAPNDHTITSFAISPDARFIVAESASPDNTRKKISIWDIGGNGAQVPLLRYQQWLPARGSIVPQLGLVARRPDCLFLFLADFDEAGRPHHTLHSYSYKTHLLSVEPFQLVHNLDTIADRLRLRVFGSAAITIRSSGSVGVFDHEKTNRSIQVNIPTEYTHSGEVYPFNNTMMIARPSGQANFAWPTESRAPGKLLYPRLSLRSPIGTAASFPKLRPLPAPNLASANQPKFVVEVGDQGHVRWSRVVLNTIDGVGSFDVPVFAGSTVLACHEPLKGSYNHWEDGIIVTVRSPLTAIMVDENDPAVSYTLGLGISRALTNSSTLFSPIHGTVYATSPDKTGIIVHHLFRPPLLF